MEIVSVPTEWKRERERERASEHYANQRPGEKAAHESTLYASS